MQGNLAEADTASQFDIRSPPAMAIVGFDDDLNTIYGSMVEYPREAPLNPPPKQRYCNEYSPERKKRQGGESDEDTAPETPPALIRIPGGKNTMGSARVKTFEPKPSDEYMAFEGRRTRWIFIMALVLGLVLLASIGALAIALIRLRQDDSKTPKANEGLGGVTDEPRDIILIPDQEENLPSSAPAQQENTLPSTRAPAQQETTHPSSAPAQQETTLPSSSAPEQQETTLPSNAPAQQDTTHPSSAPVQQITTLPPSSAPVQQETTLPSSAPARQETTLPSSAPVQQSASPVQETTSPIATQPPVLATRDDLLQVLAQLTPGSLELLENIDTLQYRAFAWLSSDPNYFDYDDSRLIQRWVLAIFYLTFEGGNLSPFSARHLEASAPESYLLTDWMSYSDECFWHSAGSDGFCNEEGLVRNIDIRDGGLSGTLPKELALLSNSLGK